MRRLSLAHVFHGTLTLIWWLALLGAPVLALVVATTSWWSMPIAVAIPADAVTGGAAVTDVVGRLHSDDLASGPRWAVAGIWLLGAWAWLPVVWLLRRFTGSVVHEGPFAAPAVRLLPWIGGGLVAIALVDAYLDYARSAVATASAGALDAPTVAPSGALMLAGFVVIGLGEVFRHGQALQHGEDLTI